MLIDRFERDHTTQVDFTLGASGQLAQQIRQGAPFDVFLSADRAFVQNLAKEGLIRSESVRSYVQGSLVLAVHRDVGNLVRSLEDLKRPEIKHVALANPDFAPYGRAARQALERAGLWDRLGPKLVRTESVRQVLQLVRTGNAEAGLVGRAGAEGPEIRTCPIDAALYDPIVQGLGIVATTRRPEAATAFVQYLVGAKAEPIWTQYGFGRVEP
jgi:molybdate transport system substrate-binding protein